MTPCRRRRIKKNLRLIEQYGFPAGNRLAPNRLRESRLSRIISADNRDHNRRVA